MDFESIYEEYHSYPSMFGEAEVFVVESADGTPMRVLFVDGGFQSATYVGEKRFEPPFAYCRAFDQLFSVAPDARRILLLGGGAYSYPKHVLTRRPEVSMDVVEIDPAVIEIARCHFYVDELETACDGRLRSFAMDGLEFLRAAEAGFYDAVVDDSFAGTVQDTALLGSEGLRLAKHCMVEGGVYMLNGHARSADDGYGYREIEAVNDALRSAFAHVQRRDVDDTEFAGCTNTVFMASDRDFGLAGFAY